MMCPSENNVVYLLGLFRPFLPRNIAAVGPASTSPSPLLAW